MFCRGKGEVGFSDFCLCISPVFPSISGISIKKAKVAFNVSPL